MTHQRRPMSYSNRWVSSPGWWPWSPGPESTSPGTMAYSRHSKYRALVTPAKRGKGKKGIAAQQQPDPTPAERRASMTWAQRLKRVFNIDIETCSECGGAVRIIASIEDPAVINQILAHPVNKARPADWPISRNGSGAVISGDEIYSNPMSAYFPTAELQLLILRIAGVGQAVVHLIESSISASIPSAAAMAFFSSPVRCFLYPSRSSTRW
jgi:hypothetical protein